MLVSGPCSLLPLIEEGPAVSHPGARCRLCHLPLLPQRHPHGLAAPRSVPALSAGSPSGVPWAPTPPTTRARRPPGRRRGTERTLRCVRRGAGFGWRLSAHESGQCLRGVMVAGGVGSWDQAPYPGSLGCL